MLSQKATLKTIVANSVVGATETTFSAFKTSAVAGEVIGVESDGTAIAGGSNKVMIISKNDSSKLNVSEPIKVSDIKHISARAYSASTEQVDYVGFNGTLGAIEVINSNLYQVNIEMANYGGTGSELRYRKQGHFNSAAAATELSIAEGLRDSLIRNFSREPDERLKFQMVCNNAGAVLGTSVDNVIFTKGSKIISATDIDDATGAGSVLAVGDLLRVGTAVTDAVYRIVSIDTSGNTATLDQAFQSATVTLADTVLERIAAADLAAADYGIKITGVAKPFKLGKIRHEKMLFVTQLVDSGDTAVTKSQAATLGIGDGKLVAEEEWFTIGNYGEMYRTGEPDLYDTSDTLNASISNKYDVISIEYVHKEETAFQEHVLRRNVNIYCNAGDGTDHTNANVLIADLDTLTSVTLATL
jgi:hypothetical protein